MPTTQFTDWIRNLYPTDTMLILTYAVVVFTLYHGSPYWSVPINRPIVRTLRTDILTHDMVGHTDRLVYTVYTGLLSDWNTPLIPCSTLWTLVFTER